MKSPKRFFVLLAVLAVLCIAGVGGSLFGGSDAGDRDVDSLAKSLEASIGSWFVSPVDTRDLSAGSNCNLQNDNLTIAAGGACAVSIGRSETVRRRLDVALQTPGLVQARLQPATPPADDKPRPVAGEIILRNPSSTSARTNQQEASFPVYGEGGVLHFSNCQAGRSTMPVCVLRLR